MQAAASVNTGLVEVFRSSDYCIVAPVAWLDEMAKIRTNKPDHENR